MDLKLLNTNKPVSSYVKSIVVVLFHVINGFVDTTMSARKCTEFLTSIYQNQICVRHIHIHACHLPKPTLRPARSFSRFHRSRPFSDLHLPKPNLRPTRSC